MQTQTNDLHRLCQGAPTDSDICWQSKKHYKLTLKDEFEQQGNGLLFAAERDWLLGNNGPALLVWRAAVRTHLPPVNTNRATRAAGGGPEASVAVHVKHQQAGVKHVKADSTCVSRKKKKVSTNAFFCIPLMLFSISRRIPWHFIRDTLATCASGSLHAC